MISRNSGSPFITPGKFITSATPIAPNSFNKTFTSWAVKDDEALSNFDAGTQLDAAIPNVNGMSAAASITEITPGSPATFATSCGSHATAVVPFGNTAFTNSETHTFDDSRCICASTNPEHNAAPSTSIVASASRVPHPTTFPSHTARSVVTHSRVAGLNTRPPVMSRSAGPSPRAAANAFCDTAGRATA